MQGPAITNEKAPCYGLWFTCPTASTAKQQCSTAHGLWCFRMRKPALPCAPVQQNFVIASCNGPTCWTTYDVRHTHHVYKWKEQIVIRTERARAEGAMSGFWSPARKRHAYAISSQQRQQNGCMESSINSKRASSPGNTDAMSH